MSRRYRRSMRHPSGMVLLVERQVAPAIRRTVAASGAAARDRPRRWMICAAGVNSILPPAARGSPRRSPRPRCTGSTARRAGRPPRRPLGRTSRHAPLTQSTKLLARGEPLDLGVRRPILVGSHHEHLLTQLVQRRDHPAERQLGAPVAVDQPRTGDAARRVAVEPRDRADRSHPAGTTRVAVEQQEQVCRALARIPALLPAANPALRAIAITRTRRGSAAPPRRCRPTTRCRRR